MVKEICATTIMRNKNTMDTVEECLTKTNDQKHEIQHKLYQKYRKITKLESFIQ